MPSPLYLLRHAETVFNRAARMQGNEAVTPLTLAGVRQADAMGAALAAHFRATAEPVPRLWSSPAPRALQTAAILADHLGIDWFAVRVDARLRELEVGRWVGRDYAEIVASEGEIIDLEHRLFRMPIPGGEHYRDVAARLRAWLDEAGAGPAVVVSHGITTRVLRGLLVGGRAYEGVPIAPDTPQGTVMRVADGQEVAICVGDGARAFRAA
ncbi:MAG: histidine phosphatase family protein [Sphingomonadaceae bacterium]|uniref:histidine phosphatase family protein n=1 Tax=Thermaurantiacus sp. TaxID=2820283 RepID=UPI00298EE4FC|nr:histidine phosphatase family protein [Thermaurantiacus sp.]MCS6987474.1 histidine phosphatase family protein [Sphingomonadaceae bacterium]MDW8415394.1 histidine phosphatase family protein [Thermaurantiacus sp.]